MALKLVLVVTVIVAALALPIAKGTNVVVEVQPSFVPCSLGANVTATPPFPNAQVQLWCGARNVVASTTTNASGVFSFSLDSTRLSLLPTVPLNLCNLVVTTPLSSCNSTLPPVGILESRIQFIRSSVLGLRIVLTFGPVGFRYSSST